MRLMKIIQISTLVNLLTTYYLPSYLKKEEKIKESSLLFSTNLQVRLLASTSNLITTSNNNLDQVYRIRMRVPQ